MPNDSPPLAGCFRSNKNSAMRRRAVCVLFSLCLTTLFYGLPSRSQTAAPDSVILMFGGDVTFADYFEREVGDSLSYPVAKMKKFWERGGVIVDSSVMCI